MRITAVTVPIYSLTDIVTLDVISSIACLLIAVATEPLLVIAVFSFLALCRYQSWRRFHYHCISILKVH